MLKKKTQHLNTSGVRYNLSCSVGVCMPAKYVCQHWSESYSKNLGKLRNTVRRLCHFKHANTRVANPKISKS